jgi:hypothetical protein
MAIASGIAPGFGRRRADALDGPGQNHPDRQLEDEAVGLASSERKRLRP